MIAAKITQEEKDSTRQTVDEDRKHAIEAAIVRAPHPPTPTPPHNHPHRLRCNLLPHYHARSSLQPSPSPDH